MSLRNILIINQPWGNRGDEAAHRALIRQLNVACPETKITILGYLDYNNAEHEFVVEHPNNNYVQFYFPFNYGAVLLDKFVTLLGWVNLALLIHPIFRKLVPYYKQADLILSAPGGICMGGFQNWHHLFLLKVAQTLRKPIAYYSRSFGPFPTQTWSNRRFKKISIDLLKYCKFLSIRDSKTMQLADSIKLSYTAAIDTAFLEQPQVILPKEITTQIGMKYIVFVPNSLTWHYAYTHCKQEKIDSFYQAIINELRTLYPDHKIVFLPQLCSIGKRGDYYYFKKLAQESNYNNCIAIPETYGSDIQQTIIRNASLMIGARYHSIVFAINNYVPFVALDYEHKITGMLEELGLEAYKVSIQNIFSSEVSILDALIQIKNKLSLPMWEKEKMDVAHNLARSCLESLIHKWHK